MSLGLPPHLAPACARSAAPTDASGRRRPTPTSSARAGRAAAGAGEWWRRQEGRNLSVNRAVPSWRRPFSLHSSALDRRAAQPARCVRGRRNKSSWPHPRRPPGCWFDRGVGDFSRSRSRGEVSMREAHREGARVGTGSRNSRAPQSRRPEGGGGEGGGGRRRRRARLEGGVPRGGRPRRRLRRRAAALQGVHAACARVARRARAPLGANQWRSDGRYLEAGRQRARCPPRSSPPRRRRRRRSRRRTSPPSARSRRGLAYPWAGREAGWLIEFTAAHAAGSGRRGASSATSSSRGDGELRWATPKPSAVRPAPVHGEATTPTRTRGAPVGDVFRRRQSRSRARAAACGSTSSRSASGRCRSPSAASSAAASARWESVRVNQQDPNARGAGTAGARDVRAPDRPRLPGGAQS